MKLEDIRDISIQIARAAGEVLCEGYGKPPQIEQKSTAVDWVTQYDKAAEDVILERLARHFPDHQVVAEESGHHDNASAYTWYIDPLDGTTNFSHQHPTFAVSMGLYQGETPQVGVVYDPMRDECFSAVAGGGAQVERRGKIYPLRVSETAALLTSLLASGFPYDRHTSGHDNIAQTRAFLKRAQGMRRHGAAALDMAYVAAGRLDGYWEFKLSSWDIAAGVLLVEEAGGSVTGIDGRPFTLSPRPSLVASNGRIHEAMIDVLNDVAARQNGEKG
jgi:myo-inositol-1(or 4)-monophosphatase